MMAPVNKTLRTTTLFILLCGWVAPVWAGIGMKARLESYTYNDAWVEVEAAIGDGQVRLDFQGPWSHGSLIYDRENSLVTVVDDLHKTILPLTQDNQTALKLIGAIAADRLQKEIAGSRESAQKTFEVVEENARAFFNGVPALRKQGVQKTGFTCDEYRTDLDGKRAREVWVASPEKAGMSEEDYSTLRSLIHLMVDLCGGELAQWGVDTTNFQAGLSQPQLPVLAVLYAKGKPSGHFQILRVRSRDFSPRTFDPPAGYQTLSLFDIIKR
jgi:hypothetical protein